MGKVLMERGDGLFPGASFFWGGPFFPLTRREEKK
jgi:hypothetical protein